MIANSNIQYYYAVRDFVREDCTVEVITVIEYSGDERFLMTLEHGLQPVIQVKRISNGHRILSQGEWRTRF